MQQDANKMPIIRDKISSKTDMHLATSHATRMQDIVIEAVNARRRRGGQSEAIFGVARDMRLSARRVTAFLRGEVKRVWSDEFERAQHWQAHFLACEAARSTALAAEYERRIAELGKDGE